MAVTDRLRLFYFFHLSKPASDRPVYQTIHERQLRRIFEFGVGDGQRALRMIEVAALQFPADQVCYTGLDLFEARPSSEGGLSLKAAHSTLRATGARIQLLPGDPQSALLRLVCTRQETYDLVLVSSQVDRRSMAQAWHYLPRLLHGESQVFVEIANKKGGSVEMRHLSRREIDARALRSQELRRAA